MTGPADEQRRPRRALLPAVAAAAAAGALLVLLTAGRVWGTATVTAPAHRHVSVTGRQVVPSLTAVSLALLALAVAVLAARGVVRQLVGAVGVVTAVSAFAVSIAGRTHVGRSLADHAFGVTATSLPSDGSLWWLVAAFGAALSGAAYALVAVRGARWEGMGARYDAPRAAGRRGDPAVEAWDALDRGDDPTA